MDIQNKTLVDVVPLPNFAALYQGFKVQEVDVFTQKRGIEDLVNLGFKPDVALSLSKAYADQLREIVGSLMVFLGTFSGKDCDLSISISGSVSDTHPEVYIEVRPDGPFEVKFGVHVGHMGKASPGYETPEQVMGLLLDDKPVDQDTVVIEDFHPGPDSFFCADTLDRIKEYVGARGLGRKNNFSVSNAPGGGKFISIASADVVLQDGRFFLFSHRFSFAPELVTVRNNEVLADVVVQLKRG